jgi:uncharacterized membrane protein YbjE (DUF340 family)
MKPFIISLIGMSIIGISIGYVLGFYVHKYFVYDYLLYLPVFIIGVGCSMMIYAALFLKEKK